MAKEQSRLSTSKTEREGNTKTLSVRRWSHFSMLKSIVLYQFLKITSHVIFFLQSAENISSVHILSVLIILESLCLREAPKGQKESKLRLLINLNRPSSTPNSDSCPLHSDSMCVATRNWRRPRVRRMGDIYLACAFVFQIQTSLFALCSAPAKGSLSHFTEILLICIIVPP